MAAGLQHHGGWVVGTLFAIALIDASVIGAGAVSLSTADAIGDVFKINHSLHREPTETWQLEVVYGGLIALAAALVLVPGTPLGLLTNAVQTLTGLLLPSATVFLLLLCNDKAVLSPWRNCPWLNLFTGAVIALLVMLSVIRTVSVLYPKLSAAFTGEVFLVGSVLAIATWLGGSARRRRGVIDRTGRADWRMPPLERLAPARLTEASKLWMLALRGYLVVAGGLVLVRIAQLAIGHHA